MKPDVKRKGKFDTRAEEGTLVGYRRDNAYRVLLIEGRTVVESKDVKFLEYKMQTVVTAEKYTDFDLSNPKIITGDDETEADHQGTSEKQRKFKVESNSRCKSTRRRKEIWRKIVKTKFCL